MGLVIVGAGCLVVGWGAGLATGLLGYVATARNPVKRAAMIAALQRYEDASHAPNP